MNTKINTYWTSDLDLASALIALGFRLVKDQPITRVLREGGKHTDTFYFQPEASTDDFGTLTARKVFKAWSGSDTQAVEKFKAKHPEAYSAIDYMSTMAKNRALMLECIKTKVTPMVHTKIDGYDCYMPLNASAELKAKMQSMIKNET